MKNEKKKSFILGFLDRIEKAGNKLPQPMTIFFYLAIFVVLLSGIGSLLHWQAMGEVYDATSGKVSQTTIHVVNLFSIEGVKYMLANAVSNFTNYAPLGFTIVIMIGIGVAEQAGYLSGLIKKAVQITPKQLVTPMVVFIGVMTNLAENAGYVVFIPLAAMIFKAYKKHPLAGVAAGFAGVSGGFSANLLLGSTDVTLASFSDVAAKSVDPSYTVNATANWFFMFASAILLTIVGTFVTEKIIIPRLGEYKENGDGTLVELSDSFSEKENKALKASNLVFLGLVVALVLLSIPQNSFLRNPETGSLINNSLLMNAIIPLFVILFFVPSYVYGKMTGAFKSDKDIVGAISKAIAGISGFVAMAFVASQFTNYFNYTNIGKIMSIKGANFLLQLKVSPILLIVLFILGCCFINLFMASASAKWAIFAPVFIPMLMKLGISPELTQVAYRIGDSSTNIIAPVVAWIPYILTIMKKYDKDSGWGTLVSLMLPFSMFFLISWIVLLVLWMVFNLPLGPGVFSFLA